MYVIDYTIVRWALDLTRDFWAEIENKICKLLKHIGIEVHVRAGISLKVKWREARLSGLDRKSVV